MRLLFLLGFCGLYTALHAQWYDVLAGRGDQLLRTEYYADGQLLEQTVFHENGNRLHTIKNTYEQGQCVKMVKTIHETYPFDLIHEYTYDV